MQTIKNNYFIVTHQAPAWEIPFAHRIIGVEGYIPNSSIGISAGNVIGKVLDLETALGALRSLIRAKVEHPFRVIKCQFGHRKTRYRGLAKNTSQLLVMFALSNLWMVRKRITQGLAA
jgi:IS5 family transposase